MTNGVIITGPIDYYTGFGRMTCNLIKQFVSRNIPVKAIATNPPYDPRLECPAEIHLALASDLVWGKPLLICQFPDLADRLKYDDVVLTMCESTRIDPAGVVALNSLARIVITPSVWGAVVLSANGVTIPIKVVPLGVDDSIFKPDLSLFTGVPEIQKFGASGRVYYDGKRKGIDDVIAAFKMAFPNEKDVRLSLKLFEDCIKPKIDDDRISIIDGLLSDQQMAVWYQSLSCFVSASKCEGWGLQVHEAIMCNVPVIAPAYSGLAELVLKGLDFEIIEAAEGCYSGHWCQPNIEQMAGYMQAIRSTSWNGLGLDVGRYTTEFFADNILKILNS